MTVEHVFRVQQLLEHVHTDRWGTGGRNRAALLVVAERSSWPGVAPISARDFEEAGRDALGAKYDRDEVMPRLLNDGVLIRVGSVRRGYWGINNDLSSWRRVPGDPSWRKVVALFSGRLFEKPARQFPNLAGQSARQIPARALLDAVYREALSVIQPGIDARLPGNDARPPGETPPGTGKPRAAEPPPSQCFYGSKEPITSEEEERRVDQEAERLGQVVARRIGKPRLWGRARHPIEATIRRYPDHVGDLYQVAETVPPEILDPLEAARTFEALADEAASRDWVAPADPRLEVLRRLIVTLEQQDPDSERLVELRAELDSKSKSRITDVGGTYNA